MANFALRTRKITWNVCLFIILQIFCWILDFIFYECFICISFRGTCQTAWRWRIAGMLNNWRLRVWLVIHRSKRHFIRRFDGLLWRLSFSIRSWTNLDNCLIGLFGINTLLCIVNYTRFLLSKILLVRIFLAFNIQSTKLSLRKSFSLLFVKALSCRIEWVISLLLQLVDLG